MMDDLHTSVLVIGAGLSGLHTASMLADQGIDVLVAEARNRLGGRIISHNYSSREATNHRFDLGPSWFWPHQQRIQKLVEELKLETTVFEQYSGGAGVYEESAGSVHHGIQGISMAGSLRLAGGMGSLIDALENKVPDQCVKRECEIRNLQWHENEFRASGIHHNKSVTIHSEKVVIALPPRIAIQTITFSPTLPDERVQHLQEIPTWMASQGKAVIEYATPFWKQNGYSGDAFSQSGPLREIHDASSANESAHALFGFVDAGFLQRDIDLKDQQKLIHEQAIRLFGPTKETPLQIQIVNWSRETFTSVKRDSVEPSVHSMLELKQPADPEFSENLIWSGTEAASTRHHNNGYLEGAIEASEKTIQLLSA